MGEVGINGADLCTNARRCSRIPHRMKEGRAVGWAYLQVAMPHSKAVVPELQLYYTNECSKPDKDVEGGKELVKTKTSLWDSKTTVVARDRIKAELGTQKGRTRVSTHSIYNSSIHACKICATSFGSAQLDPSRLHVSETD